jgi:hypothetical protein
MRIWTLVVCLVAPGMARTEDPKVELERTRQEVRRLQEQLKERDAQVEELRKRTQTLAKQFAELSKELTTLRSMSEKSVRPATAPAGEWRGVIRQYQSEAGVVSISLPKDVEVKMGQTYDMLVTKPSLRSLGRIRIGSVQDGNVLARFLGDAPADTDVRGGMEVTLAPTVGK